jgi:hypothetical protein
MLLMQCSPVMKFTCYSRWRELPPGVEQLFASCAETSMFMSREWFETLEATTLKETQTLMLACVVDRENVLALLPLVSDDGQHWQSLNHRYTALVSLLVTDREQDAVVDCLAEGLSRLDVVALRLEPVAEQDTGLSRLESAMESRGYTSHRHFFFYNWFHRTHEQSFNEYMAERPSRVRNTIARKQRKLEREHDCQISMFRQGQVVPALADYHAAYTASWKAHEQYADLLDAVAINLAVPDWTRLAVLFIDGNPAAAQLWFVVHQKASIFRLAYNEAWKHYSPGSILTAYLMQYVINNDKVAEIDFLTGNEAYKQDWMSERRQRWRLVLARQNTQRNTADSLITRLGRFLRKSQAGS